jgi:4-hydroxy-tetrahydrodipicolinate synthase
LILLGGEGNISVTANIAPRAMAQMCALALEGDGGAARQLNDSLARVHQQLFVESNPIPVKWALKRMGKIPAGIRLPLTPLADEYHGDLEQALDSSVRMAMSGIARTIISGPRPWRR